MENIENSGNYSLHQMNKLEDNPFGGSYSWKEILKESRERLRMEKINRDSYNGAYHSNIRRNTTTSQLPELELAPYGHVCHGYFTKYLSQKLSAKCVPDFVHDIHYDAVFHDEYEQGLFFNWLNYMMNESPFRHPFIYSGHYELQGENFSEVILSTKIVHPLVVSLNLIAIRWAKDSSAVRHVFQAVQEMGYTKHTAFLAANIFGCENIARREFFLMGQGETTPLIRIRDWNKLMKYFKTDTLPEKFLVGGNNQIWDTFLGSPYSENDIFSGINFDDDSHGFGDSAWLNMDSVVKVLDRIEARVK